MKRLNYDGVSLVTGTEVADALANYLAALTRMATSAVVDIPVLENNGEIKNHTLVLNAGSPLEVADIDGEPSQESERFPVPEFPAVGGSAVAVEPEDIPAVPLPED